MKQFTAFLFAVLAILVNVFNVGASNGRVEIRGKSPFYATCRTVEVDTESRMGRAWAACQDDDIVTLSVVDQEESSVTPVVDDGKPLLPAIPSPEKEDTGPSDTPEKKDSGESIPPTKGDDDDSSKK